MSVPRLPHCRVRRAAPAPQDAGAEREVHSEDRPRADLIPPFLRKRPKQPYRATDVPSFFDVSTGTARFEYVDELLSGGRPAASGLFNPQSRRAAGRESERRTGRGDARRDGARGRPVGATPDPCSSAKSWGEQPDESADDERSGRPMFARSLSIGSCSDRAPTRCQTTSRFSSAGSSTRPGCSRS